MKIKREISVFTIMRKFRSGFQVLSNIEWVSAYGSHLSAATILGVVGLFLAVRDGRMVKFSNLLLLSARNSSSEKNYFVPGLRNLGNNCFLNVVLQSLASCSRFRCFLEDAQKLQGLSAEEQAEDLPLLVSLADLLEELCTLQEKSRPLNPLKVMTAMQQYIPRFQLSNQQDAAEAFLHLLSCLRDELSESYMPNYGSIADVAAPTSRILSFGRIEDYKEPERWRKQYLGPFDGILGSFLTCRSCSSEILMDFDFFHILPLSLILNAGSFKLDKFILEDCIKRYLAPEHVENYSCSCCWHVAAVKYLSSFGGRQEEINKLSCCSKHDCCDCRNLSSLRALPWTNRFSHASKQLSIAHCPQILCLHLQRTSMNAFGELVKIQGHIYFPMILNLSPFAKYEIGIQRQEDKPKKLAEQPHRPSTTHPIIVDCHSDPMTAKDEASQHFPEPCSSLTGTCCNTKVTNTLKVESDPLPPKKNLYRLVSVVEHFGRAGSGHYTVYRGVTHLKDGNTVRESDNHLQWFRISDSEVHYASEEDVLNAEATLLFYERI